MTNVVLAFLLTLFAGLSTGIGSLISLLTKKTNFKFFSVALGFSAGIMLYVSFVEIFFKAQDLLVAEYGEMGNWINVGAFFLGILLIGAIDRFVPSMGNPHEIHTVEEMDGKDEHHKKNLMRMSMFSAIAIAIHNFPEGIATFTSVVQDPASGATIAIAIAIHNIPEGIAIAVPVFYATGNRKKAFTWSLLSGLSEPVGALLAYLLLFNFMSDVFMGVLFAMVAGIMVFISLDELLPTARAYDTHHLSIYGLVLGMGVMAVSLLVLG